MTEATGLRSRDTRTRIGKPTAVVMGDYFPRTEDGDEVAVYGVGFGAPRVGLMLNLSTVEITPSEARDLASTLQFHAEKIDPEAKA